MLCAGGECTVARRERDGRFRMAPMSASESVPGAAWLTWANAVSALRLLAAPVSLAAVLNARWQLAAALFAGAVASDLLDGRIARRTGTASPRGMMLDHGADAAYVTLTLWGLAYAEAQTGADIVPGILPLFIALAFLQYVLDSRALGGAPLRASLLGRINGIAYFAFAGIVLLRAVAGSAWPPDAAIYWTGLALVVSTLASMAIRLHALLKADDGR